jgi:hypothetical protein
MAQSAGVMDSAHRRQVGYSQAPDAAKRTRLTKDWGLPESSRRVRRL